MDEKKDFNGTAVPEGEEGYNHGIIQRINIED